MTPLSCLVILAALASKEAAGQTGPGKYIVNDGDTYTITSPGYPAPYSGRMRRRWRFTPANPATVLSATCDTLELLDTPNCHKDKLVFKNPFRQLNYPRKNRKVEKVCGSQSGYTYDTSELGNGLAMQIDFKGSPNGGGGAGFNCTIRGQNCIEGQVLSDTPCMTITCTSNVYQPQLNSNCSVCSSVQTSLLQFDSTSYPTGALSLGNTYIYAQEGLTIPSNQYVQADITMNGFFTRVTTVTMKDAGDASSVSCTVDSLGVGVCEGHTITSNIVSLSDNIMATEITFSPSSPVKYYAMIGQTFTIWLGNSVAPTFSMFHLPGTVTDLDGLCGNDNGDDSDDLVKPDGSTAIDITDFADSWTN